MRKLWSWIVMLLFASAIGGSLLMAGQPEPERAPGTERIDEHGIEQGQAVLVAQNKEGREDEKVILIQADLIL